MEIGTMETLRQALVTFKGQKVGRIEEVPEGGTAFTYDADAPEIGCSLPRTTDRHTYRAGVHPFFSNLAPEGWLRARQEAIADTEDEDDFGLLLAFGQDCIGAVGIAPTSGERPEIDLAVGADAETQAIAESRRTISGVQAKLLCVKEGNRFTPAAHQGPAPYIAKFARDDLGDLVQNEEASLLLTKALLPDDQIVSCQRGFVQNIDKLGLIVERFDREYIDGEENKLRCEDFAQVLAVTPGRDRKNKYRVDYDALSEALKHSAAPKLDAYTLFRRIVAFAILGNTDCHLKNWSLLETPIGLRLSPIYDVLNSYIYGGKGYSTVFGLELDGKRLQWQEYDRTVLTEVGRKLGLNQRTIEAVFTDIKKRKTALKECLKSETPLNDELQYQFTATIEEKWETLYG